MCILYCKNCDDNNKKDDRSLYTKEVIQNLNF